MVHVKIDEHDTYSRDDFDLHMDCKISVFDVNRNAITFFISKNKIKTTIPEL